MGKGRAFSNRGQKGTFPDYNNYLGMKRGQSPVVPFFRGGEGDGTFNGFVLSSVYGINYINIKLKTPQLDFYDALQFILPMMAF